MTWKSIGKAYGRKNRTYNPVPLTVVRKMKPGFCRPQEGTRSFETCLLTGVSTNRQVCTDSFKNKSRPFLSDESIHGQTQIGGSYMSQPVWYFCALFGMISSLVANENLSPPHYERLFPTQTAAMNLAGPDTILPHQLQEVAIPKTETDSLIMYGNELIIVWRADNSGPANKTSFEKALVSLWPKVRVTDFCKGRKNKWFLLVNPGKTLARKDLELSDLQKKEKRILAVAPNYRRQFLDVPNDPLFEKLWHLQNTGQTDGSPGADANVLPAWQIQTGSRAVTVAIIDSGVVYDHPDLAPNMWRNPGETPGNGIDDDGNGLIDDVIGYDFGEGDPDPADNIYHGTHVAGITGAAGNNGIGVSGISQHVSLMALKVSDANGGIPDFAAIAAIHYASNMGAKVINASWGGFFYSEPLRLAIQDAGAAGVLFVASAGNEYTSSERIKLYPASYDLDNILSIAATDHNDQIADFSNYSKFLVDLAAPGVDILSTLWLEEILFDEDFQTMTSPAFPPNWENPETHSQWITSASAVAGEEETIVLKPHAQNNPFPSADTRIQLPLLATEKEGIYFIFPATGALIRRR